MAMAMELRPDWKLLGEIKGGGDHTKNCQQAVQRALILFGTKEPSEGIMIHDVC